MAIEKKLEYAVHPGIILKDFLKNTKMKQKELAQKLGMQQTQLNEILNAKRSVTAELAIKLEPIFQLPANFWMRLQADYSVYQCREMNLVTTETVNTETRESSAKSFAVSKQFLLAA